MELIEGLQPEVVATTNGHWHELSDKFAHIIAEGHRAHESILWIGEAGEASRHESLQRKNKANHQREELQSYAKENIRSLAEDLETTKTRGEKLMLSNIFSSSSALEEEAARLLQNLYGQVGSSRVGGLLYPGATFDRSGLHDRGATPSGPSSAQPASRGTGGAPHAAGDSAFAGSSPQSGDDPQETQNPSGGKPDGKGDSLGGAPSGEGAGGKGSGAGPDGGGPGGPPPGGPSPSGFGDPDTDDLAENSAASGIGSSGSGIGFAGTGGFGAGERERSLTQNPATGGVGKPVVNFNAAKPAASSPSVIGGGGATPGPLGRKDEKERKSAAFLSNQKNTDALLGPDQSVAADVLGSPVAAESKPAEQTPTEENTTPPNGEQRQPEEEKTVTVVRRRTLSTEAAQ
ncbi:hypothetical protein [Segniliparus rotundus]|nr:hypothetical protein [Segniliparus rotundus]